MPDKEHETRNGERADAAPTVSKEPVLRLRGVSKTFSGTRALRDVDLDILPGEVHALVGANGSGKSTLIKILSGFHHADPGALAWLAGKPFDMADVSDARHDRLRFVHQDLALVHELGVMDNLALRHMFVRGRIGNVDWHKQMQVAQAALDRFGVSMDLRRPLSEAAPVERVIVAIVGALQGWEGGEGVLVLDEPSAVLPTREGTQLFSMIDEVRRTGTSVLYVSHRLDEIFELADRVTVLRGGERVATCDIDAVTPRQLVSMIAGEDVDPEYRAEAPKRGTSTIALEARGLRARYLRGCDLTVHEGEVVGLAGLPGSGAEEIPYILAGAPNIVASGSVRLPSRDDHWVEVRDARKLRLPLVPADRARQAIVPHFSVRENLTLSVLSTFRTRLGLDLRRERGVARRWMSDLQVRAAGDDAAITTLSGGNQQKVIIARCLASQPSVLLLCEPTAGVDVHTRHAIYDLVSGQARAGLAVVVTSTDVQDLLGICTRVIVMRDGMPIREIAHDEMTQSRLIHAMEGID